MTRNFRNLNVYDSQASTLAASYNSLATPDILPDFAEYILSLPDRSVRRALDLGCGSGRDAFWIAQQGLSVIAMDGAPAMLTKARTLHSHPLIHYVQGEAPEMRTLTDMGIKFDIVLMSAFLFHFDTSERQEFYNNLKPLLRNDSYLFVTLRHGPTPPDRKMHAVPLQELEDFAQARGGFSFYHGQKPDPLKRADVFWDHLSMRLK